MNNPFAIVVLAAQKELAARKKKEQTDVSNLNQQLNEQRISIARTFVSLILSQGSIYSSADYQIFKIFIGFPLHWKSENKS